MVSFIILTKLWVVSGTFSKTSTWSSSPVNQEMSVSQPMGFFSLMWAGQSLNMKYDSQCDIALACFCSNDGNVCAQNTVLTHPEPCKPHSILGSGLASSEPSLRSLSPSSHSELEPETHKPLTQVTFISYSETVVASGCVWFLGSNSFCCFSLLNQQRQAEYIIKIKGVTYIC